MASSIGNNPVDAGRFSSQGVADQSPTLMAIQMLQQSLIDLGKMLEDMGEKLKSLRSSEPPKEIKDGKNMVPNPAHGNWENAVQQLASSIDEMRNKTIPGKQRELEEAKAAHEAEKAAKAARSQEQKDAETNIQQQLKRSESMLDRLKAKASDTAKDPLIESLQRQKELAQKDVIVKDETQKRLDFAKESSQNALPVPGQGRFTEPEPRPADIKFDPRRVGGVGGSKT